MTGRVEAERRLIGAILARPGALDALRATPVGAASFREPEYRRAFEAVAAMLDGETVNVDRVAKLAGLSSAWRDSLGRAVSEDDGGPVEQLASDLLDLVGEEPADDPLPAALLPASRLLDTSYPPLAFIARPYVPRAEVIEVVGPHGSFKSTIAFDLALAVASGRPWCGVPVTRGRSAFITMEDREPVIAHRATAYLAGVRDTDGAAAAEAAEKAVREGFAFLAREQTQALALTDTDRAGTVLRQSTVERLADLVAGRDLVILETTSRLHPGPESNEALAVFASATEYLATTAGAAVGVVRHVPKATARDTEREPDSYWGRGGGAFSDAARSVLNVRKDPPADGERPDPLAVVRVTQTKPPPFSRCGEPLAWKPTLVDPNDPHGPIYLRSLSQEEQAREAAAMLYRHLVELLPAGLTRTQIHNDKPAGLRRDLAKAAVDRLFADRRVTVTDETRGKTMAKVYRAVPPTT